MQAQAGLGSVCRKRLLIRARVAFLLNEFLLLGVFLLAACLLCAGQAACGVALGLPEPWPQVTKLLPGGVSSRPGSAGFLGTWQGARVRAHFFSVSRGFVVLLSPLFVAAFHLPILGDLLAELFS